MDLNYYKDQLLGTHWKSCPSGIYKQVEAYVSSVNGDTYKLIGISAATLLSVWFVIKLFNNGDSNGQSSAAKKRRKKKGKKPAVPVIKETPGETIDKIMNQLKDSIIPEFNQFKENVEAGSYKNKTYKKQTTEDPNYMILRFNETFLTKLMELDAVDTSNDEQLRLRRKSSIKYIQEYHKQLDELKKTVKQQN